MIIKINIDPQDVDAISLMREINKEKIHELKTTLESGWNVAEEALLAMTITMDHVLEQLYYGYKYMSYFAYTDCKANNISGEGKDYTELMRNVPKEIYIDRPHLTQTPSEYKNELLNRIKAHQHSENKNDLNNHLAVPYVPWAKDDIEKMFEKNVHEKDIQG